MTQSDLSRKTGFDEAYISRILSGNANLTLHSIARLEFAFDATLFQSHTNL